MAKERNVCNINEGTRSENMLSAAINVRHLKRVEVKEGKCKRYTVFINACVTYALLIKFERYT